MSEQPIYYRLPQSREFRLLRDFTWRQGFFLFCMVALAAALLVTGRFIASGITLALGVIGCLGYAQGPGYRYPLLLWQASLHNARKGAVYNEQRQKLAIPMWPFDFGPFAANFNPVTGEFILAFDAGPSLHAADDTPIRHGSDRGFASLIADVLSLDKSVTGGGFLVAQRPSDPRKADKKRKERSDYKQLNEFPDGSVAALRHTNVEQYERHVQAMIDGTSTLSHEERRMVWMAERDRANEEAAEECSKFFRLLYFVVKCPGEWKGIATDDSAYDPASLQSSLLQQIVDLTEGLLPQSGYTKAKVLTMDNVCDLDFSIWHGQTLAESRLLEVPASYEEHVDDEGNVDVWPRSMSTIGDLLNTEGTLHAFQETRNNLFKMVEPGGLDHLLMSRSNPSLFAVNLRFYRTSTKLDTFVLRRQQARNKGGLFGINAQNESEEAYQEKVEQNIRELDDLNRSGNGMIRWTRLEMISGLGVYDVEERALPSHALSRWRSNRYTRVTGSFTTRQIARMLGA